ncbi:MAG: histidine phosphatase family protein [Burkholderiales bacterium]
MRWLVIVVALAAFPAKADEALWKAVQQGGHVLFIRHALTEPGFGDPPGFELKRCATQRNLSAQGRAQAKRLGEALRERHVPIGDVLASPWCRCVETAQLAFGRAQTWTALSNLHARQQNAEKQVRALRPRVAAHRGKANLVLVSHGSTAGALTGEHPAMGEVLVLKPDGEGFRVAGRLSVP